MNKSAAEIEGNFYNRTSDDDIFETIANMIDAEAVTVADALALFRTARLVFESSMLCSKKERKYAKKLHQIADNLLCRGIGTLEAVAVITEQAKLAKGTSAIN